MTVYSRKDGSGQMFWFVHTLCVLEVNSGSDPQRDEEHRNACRHRESQLRHKPAVTFQKAKQCHSDGTETRQRKHQCGHLNLGVV